MRIQKVAVKGKDGVIQVAEIGGEVTKEELQEALDKKLGKAGLGCGLDRFEINYEGSRVMPGNRTLTWAEVEALTVNTGTAPTAEEKEMYRDEDGGYTRKRIVYDGYISADQARIAVGSVPIEAYAKTDTSVVTMYNVKWAPTISDAHVDLNFCMNANANNRRNWLRDGMDDMGAALGTEAEYTAQQRVYVDVESPSGAVGYYVLVLHNALDSSREIWCNGSGFSDGNGVDGAPIPRPGAGSGENSSFSVPALWAYPAGTAMEDMPPNVEVEMTSTQAQALLDSGNGDELSNDIKTTLAKYGSEGDYPVKFRARVPYCQYLMLRIDLLSPLSDVGVSKPGKAVVNYSLGGEVLYFDTAGVDSLTLCGRVRNQKESFVNSINAGRYFELTVEFYVPEYMKQALRAAKVSFLADVTVDPETPEGPETPIEPEEPV